MWASQPAAANQEEPNDDPSVTQSIQAMYSTIFQTVQYTKELYVGILRSKIIKVFFSVWEAEGYT